MFSVLSGKRKKAKAKTTVTTRSEATIRTKNRLLVYTDESGKQVSSYFEDKMRDGLDWIKTSTPENATIFCWWDYGHMIKAVGERNVVVRNPSKEIIDSVADPSGVREFDPNDKIVDVATALASDNQSEMLQVMDKYGATYIMICEDDMVKSVWFYRIAGLNSTDFLVNLDSVMGFTDAGKQTMGSRLLDNRNTGFTLVYEDQQMKVYML